MRHLWPPDKTIEISRTAMETARQVVNQAQIQQQVQRQVEHQIVVPDAGSGAVFLRGSGNSDLGHIEQRSLKITVANSGNATAEGKVDELAVTVLGSGDARLGKLAARSVSVQIMGSGDATVAPVEALKVTIMGSGNVHVKGHPAQIDRMIAGSGRIIEDH